MYRYLCPTELLNQLIEEAPQHPTSLAFKRGIDIVKKTAIDADTEEDVDITMWDCPGIRYVADIKSLPALISFIDETGGHISIHRRGGWNSNPSFDEDNAAIYFGDPDIGDDSCVIMIDDYCPEEHFEEEGDEEEVED